MMDIDWHPGSAKLRTFAASVLVFAGAAGAYLHFRLGVSLGICAVVWGIGVASASCGLVSPGIIRPGYVAMLLLALPVGLAVSFLLLATTYYLVLVPIGLVARMLGHDPMRRRFEPEAESYWLPRDRTADLRSYFRQY
ncbi:MAG: SxtJ family membrane protein [Planctomycetota bacterium]|jgi:hypothetical protein